MARTACLVCIISTTKKAKNALEDKALEAGTLQNLSNLYFLDIYASMQSFQNALAYFAVSYVCKMFMKSTAGVNVIKLLS